MDHSDTTMRLGFPTDIHHEALDDGERGDAKERKRERLAPLPKECPSCTRLKPAGVHACPSCGFVPERQSGIRESDGELVAIKGRDKGKLPSLEDRQQFYGMLLWHQRERGYNAGFVAHKFKERFGTWPKGLIDHPVEPDDTFRRWLKSRQIAFAKGRLNRGRRSRDAA
jgi:hypothetical protein